MGGIKRLTTLTCYTGEQYLSLDLTARRNLELTETMRSREKKGSLLWVIDRTKTAMGKRLMRKYLEQPLLNVAHITRRQEAVEELVKATVQRGELSESLSGVYDLQRLMTKVVYGTVGPRDLLSLATAASRLPEIKAVTRTLHSPKLRELDGKLHELTDVRELIERGDRPRLPAGDEGRRGHTKRVFGRAGRAFRPAPQRQKLPLPDGGAGKGKDRHQDAENRVQPGVRLLYRGVEILYQPGAEGVDPQTDAGGRRAVYHRGAERPGKPDALRDRKTAGAGGGTV